MTPEARETERSDPAKSTFTKPHAYIAIRWAFDLTDPNNVWLQLHDDQRVDVTEQLTERVKKTIGEQVLASWYDIAPPPTDASGHMAFDAMETFLTTALKAAGLTDPPKSITIPTPFPDDDYEITDARRRCKHYFTLAKSGTPWIETVTPKVDSNGPDYVSVTAHMQIELSWDTEI